MRSQAQASIVLVECLATLRTRPVDAFRLPSARSHFDKSTGDRRDRQENLSLERRVVLGLIARNDQQSRLASALRPMEMAVEAQGSREFSMRNPVWSSRSIAIALCRSINERRDVARSRTALRQSLSGRLTKASRRRGSSNLRSSALFLSVESGRQRAELAPQRLERRDLVVGCLDPLGSDRDECAGHAVGIG